MTPVPPTVADFIDGVSDLGLGWVVTIGGVLLGTFTLLGFLIRKLFRR